MKIYRRGKQVGTLDNKGIVTAKDPELLRLIGKEIVHLPSCSVIEPDKIKDEVTSFTPSDSMYTSALITLLGRNGFVIS